MRFIDTNVLLYAISSDAGERAKRDIAIKVLSATDLALSAQVLQEFYVQATRPTREGRLTHQQAVDMVIALTRFPVQPITVELVHAALSSRERYGLSYWDAAIIEAARALECDEVLSEDLNHGQDYAGPVVVNPFR